MKDDVSLKIVVKGRWQAASYWFLIYFPGIWSKRTRTLLAWRNSWWKFAGHQYVMDIHTYINIYASIHMCVYFIHTHIWYISLIGIGDILFSFTTRNLLVVMFIQQWILTAFLVGCILLMFFQRRRTFQLPSCRETGWSRFPKQLII